MHDSQIYLTEQSKVAYRDRCYAFDYCKIYNDSKMASKTHSTWLSSGNQDKTRSQRISMKRSVWERPYAVDKKHIQRRTPVKHHHNPNPR